MADRGQIPAIQAITIVMIRILAAYWFFTTLASYGPTFFQNVVPVQSESWYHAYYIALISVSLPAWFLAKPLSKRVLPPGNVVHPDPSAVDAQMLVTAGSFLIGFYYFLDTFPAAIRWIILALDVNESGFPVYDVGELTTTVVLSLIALIIMFRSHDIGAFFSWLRNLGAARQQPVESD